MKEIKKIKNLSLANITAVVYGLIGFFIALGVAISAMTNIIIQKDFEGSVIVVTLFNIGTGILLGLVVAIVTGILGWIIGFISAVLYNMFAVRLGGIKVELVDVARKIKKEEDVSAPSISSEEVGSVQGENNKEQEEEEEEDNSQQASDFNNL